MTLNPAKYTNQLLVYWEKSGVDGSGGSTYKPPVELKCRWDTRIEQVQLADGRTVISNSRLIVLQLLKVGSIVWLAPTLVVGQALAAWRSQSYYPRIPNNSQGGFEVFLAYHTPSRRGQPLLYEART
jgi:hypothetical protein